MTTKKQRGEARKFEKLTKEIFDLLCENQELQSVEHDVKLPGIDGLRQIDVLVRARVCGEEILTIVECKDHGRKIDITAVDSLHSKMLDVKGNKAILVARNGFSSKARKRNG